MPYDKEKVKEGRFGRGKRRFSLSRIICKLAGTSETAIMTAFIVMNLEKWLKSHLFCVFHVFSSRLFRHIGFQTSCLMTPGGIFFPAGLSGDSCDSRGITRPGLTSKIAKCPIPISGQRQKYVAIYGE
ncbi:MAG: hypothetical protein DSY90_08110 [Deltaproteobacteria bacterium]|nr:MAG: hypothetical protein DSY90_08110 [Deltaproteobacteria bacterium]